MGTDLSLAYGSIYENPNPEPIQKSVPSLSSGAQDLPIPKSSASHQTIPDPVYNPPTAMYTQQSPSPPASSSHYSESFIDKMGRRRYEVVKLFILSLVILLGISMDKIVTFYLNGYISKSFLTDMQEFLVRLGYPVTILLVLWLIKAGM